MSNRKQRRKNKKEKNKENRLYNRIIKLCVILSVLGLATYYGLYKLNNMLGNDLASILVNSEGTVEQNSLISSVKKKDRVSLLFAGTDESGLRTDSIMYMEYDTKDNKLYIMSIPRDTYTTNKYANKKINNIYFGGKHVDDLVKEVEHILTTDVDYYCVMNLDLIKTVVEEIGGLDINIKQDIWKKNKKTKEWYLFLKAGKQTLNAKQVEKLVRNRDYENGDIQREKVQREVMVTLIENILKSKNILKLPNIVNDVVSNTNTNLTVREALCYASEIKEMDTKNVTSAVTPWEYYDLNGVSYVKINEEKAASIIDGWSIKTQNVPAT